MWGNGHFQLIVNAMILHMNDYEHFSFLEEEGLREVYKEKGSFVQFVLIKNLQTMPAGLPLNQIKSTKPSTARNSSFMRFLHPLGIGFK